jgi:hypothetical protein
MMTLQLHNAEYWRARADEAIERFARYAEELEQNALDLERRARSVADSGGNREPFSANIVRLDAEKRARLIAQRRRSR